VSGEQVTQDTKSATPALSVDRQESELS